MEDIRHFFPALVAGCLALQLWGAPAPAQQTKTPAGKAAGTKGSGSNPSGKPKAVADKPRAEPAADEEERDADPSPSRAAAGRSGGSATQGKTAQGKAAAGKTEAGKTATGANSATGKSTVGAAKKKPPVRQVEGTEEDLEAPPPRSRGRDAELDEPEDRPQPRRPAGTRKRVADEDSAAGEDEEPGLQRLPRPTAEPLRIQKLSPELEQILKNWEKQTARIQKLQGDTKYREYDKTFSVEYRAEGKFAFEAPDRGNYELRPTKIQKGDVSVLKDDDKTPYELKPKDAERWICTGSQILKIDEAQKTYEVVEIPEERREDRIIEAPLPFLFGMKAEQAKQRYQIELVKESDQDIVLQLRPNWSGDAANWSKATVVISKTNYLPREVRLIAPGGTSMRIHTFENVKVNSDNIFRSLFGDDPFKPKLKNYKVVVNDRANESAPVAADREPTSKARTASAEVPAAKTKVPASAVEAAAGERKKPAGTTKK